MRRISKSKIGNINSDNTNLSKFEPPPTKIVMNEDRKNIIGPNVQEFQPITQQTVSTYYL